MGKLQFAKNIITEAEEIGIENLKTLAELKEWARNYNKVANEGGEGYVPDIMQMAHIERYEWALKVVAELEPVQEEIIEEIEEEETKMTNVMTTAWEIARKGVKNFGGNVKEYFAAALKSAWEIIKGEVTKIEKYNDLKFHVKAVNIKFNTDEMFHSAKELMKFIGFSEEGLENEMQYIDLVGLNRGNVR